MKTKSPRRVALDYFPVERDFYEDPKVIQVRRSAGHIGEYLLLRILRQIYTVDGGYYMIWDDSNAVLMANSAFDCPDEIRKRIGTFKYVVSVALKAGFFHQGKFDEFGILTSEGIQKRFFFATKTRKRMDDFVEAHLLIDISGYRKPECGKPVDNSKKNVDNPVFKPKVRNLPQKSEVRTQSKAKSFSIEKDFQNNSNIHITSCPVPSSIPAREEKETDTTGQKSALEETLEEKIKQNIDYMRLVDYYNRTSKSLLPLLDLCLTVIVETVLLQKGPVRIEGKDEPLNHVKSRFMKLTSDEVQHAIKQF